MMRASIKALATNISELGVSRRSFADLGWVWTGTLLAAGAGILTQLVIARTLQPEAFGIFSSALGLALLATPLAVFGVSQYWLKVFGEEGWAAIRWIRPGLRFVAMSSALVVAALISWALLGPNDDETRFVVLALTLTAISTALVEIVAAKLQIEQRYARYSMLGLLTPTLRLIAALVVTFALVSQNALRDLSLGYLAISLVLIVLVAPQLFQLWGGGVALSGHGNTVLNEEREAHGVAKLLCQSWVFGVAGVLYLAWAQGHVVIAKYAVDSQEAGLYAAALIVLNAICLLPSTAFAKFFLPKIHRWASHDFSRLRDFSRFANILLLIFGVVAAAFLYFFAEFLIFHLFGPEYESAAPILQLLALTMPIRSVGYNAGALLRTKRLMRLKIILLSLAVLLNLGLIYVLAPRFGILGVAATVPITELLLFSSYIYIAEVRYLRSEVTCSPEM